MRDNETRDRYDTFGYGEDGSVDPTREVIDVGVLTVALIPLGPSRRTLAWVPSVWRSCAVLDKPDSVAPDGLLACEPERIVQLHVTVYLSASRVYPSWCVTSVSRPVPNEVAVIPVDTAPYLHQMREMIDRWVQSYWGGAETHFAVWFPAN